MTSVVRYIRPDIVAAGNQFYSSEHERRLGNGLTLNPVHGMGHGATANNQVLSIIL